MSTYALDSGRRMAESRMTDACTVSRSGEDVWDEDSGQYVPGVVTIYTGPCRIRHGSSAPTDLDAGAQFLSVGKLEVHIPVGSPVLRADDVVLVTASDTRPDQVGRRFVVAGAFDGSQTTALRYHVEVPNGR